MPAPKKARKKTAEEGKLEINDLATTTDPKGGSGLADALTSTRKPPGAPDDPSLMFNYGEIKAPGPKPK